MKNYDVIVIGSGAGMTIAEEALSQGLKVALLDKGPIGGTCLNLGCIPSKILIFPADMVAEIQDARKLGIIAEIKQVDFKAIMQRMQQIIQEDRDSIHKSTLLIKDLDFYEAEGHFIKDYTLSVNGETIKGKKIFIAAGSRPFIPPLKGLPDIDYLTNETMLKLDQKPESCLIIGGGYIGVEYGHFLAAMGTRVTIIEMGDRLVQSEEPEISELLKKKMALRLKIFTNTQVLEFKKADKGYTAIVRDQATGLQKELTAEAVLIAVGRRPNSDLLHLENTGVEVDKRGFIRVDDYLETSKKYIYGCGDIIGKYMFTHVGNREAVQVWHNAMHEEPVAMDYSAVPHAVFAYPPIASVGLTEAEARKKHKILVGTTKYSNVARGLAMMEDDGFAKAVVDADSEKILGFHIIGPEAPTLIQEVIDVMAVGGNIGYIQAGMHIHPAMPELVMRTLSNLAEPQTVEIKPETTGVVSSPGRIY